jgi:hypothetical protein
MVSTDELVGESEDMISINVHPFDPERYLVREMNHGFILRAFEDRIVVYGRCDHGDSVIVELNDIEKQQAVKMGLSLA